MRHTRATLGCVTGLVAVAAVLSASAGPAAAQVPARPSIDAAACEPSGVADRPSARCSVAGSGFPGGADVRITIGTALADVVTDERGHFQAHDLRPSGDACARAEDVVAFTPASPGEVPVATGRVQVTCALAVTGRSDVLPLAGLGAGLVALGGASRFAGRRRGRHAALLLVLSRGQHGAPRRWA